MEATMTTDDDLDDLFAATRAAPPLQPSPALMTRILADADALQPRAAVARRPPQARPAPAARFSFRALVAVLGGAGSMAGLATAAVAGVWIGLAPPAAVDDLAATLWSVEDAETVDLFADLEGLIDDADG
jgi:hypothetical protein